MFCKLIAGSSDNLFLMGSPDTFCYRETHRSANITHQICNPPRRSVCDDAFKPGLAHFCINAPRRVSSLKFGALRVMTKSPASIEKPNCRKFSAWLSNVATFTWHLTSLSTLAFDAEYDVRNHGSWVEIVANVTQGAEGRDGDSDFGKAYQHEIIPVSKLSSQFLALPNALHNLIWIESVDVINDFKISFAIQTYFPGASRFGTHKIEGMEWNSTLSLSAEKPKFCLSLPGQISIASLESKGECV